MVCSLSQNGKKTVHSLFISERVRAYVRCVCACVSFRPTHAGMHTTLKLLTNTHTTHRHAHRDEDPSELSRTPQRQSPGICSPIYIHMYVCMYLCVCVYVCMYLCIYVSTYACLNVCMHVCLYVRMYVSIVYLSRSIYLSMSSIYAFL